MKTPDVVIIGAGFAGLSAAAALAEAGASVRVYEARPQLGGRATAFRDRVTGELVDNGQHVLIGAYHETAAFLNRIGADAHVSWQSALTVPFIDRAGRRSELRCASLPPPWHLLAGIVEWDGLSWTDRIAALRMASAIRLARRAMSPSSGVIAASPGETVENWLIRNGQTAATREMLWDPLALAALNQSPREAAAPAFAAVLARMFSSDARDAALGLPLQPLHLMYAEPARRFVEARGGQVLTSAPARLHVKGDLVSGVEVLGESHPAGAVISTVPWNAFGGLFADPPPSLAGLIASANAMQSSPIATVNLWLDRPVLDVPFIGLPGRTMQWVFEKRLVFGEDASHLSLVSSGAGAVAAQSNDDLIATATAEVFDALPAARQAAVVRATVVRERHATFSLAPGQPARPGTRCPVRNLLLAGDWIDTGLPGTIEGAVVSGHRAAGETSRI
jgi:hydroxysqualene dehydroxylase